MPYVARLLSLMTVGGFKCRKCSTPLYFPVFFFFFFFLLFFFILSIFFFLLNNSLTSSLERMKFFSLLICSIDKITVRREIKSNE